MLTNFKTLLESTGMNVEEELFLKPPKLPYIVFLEERDVRGSDNKNILADRNISVELYTEEIDNEAEDKIEALLNEKSIKYKKNRAWIDSEDLFQTMYDFSFTEKF